MTYYWRHNFGPGRQSEVEQLYNRQIAAVDFADGKVASIDPADYSTKTGQRVITLLASIARDLTDCLLACDYRLSDGGRMLVGKPDRTRGFASEVIGVTTYKTIYLCDTKEVDFSVWPIFAACHPQQGTFCEWRLLGKQIEAWYHYGRLPVEVGSLTPGQLEVVCYEYLRNVGILAGLTCPIGRSLHDVDIVGIDSASQPVFAQVTFACDRKTLLNKAERLRTFARGRGSCFLFSGDPSFRFDGMECISISSVFESTDPALTTAMLTPIERNTPEPRTDASA